MSLWGQVVTLRGQILVSRTDDDTMRVLCCVLCVCGLYVVCCWCAVCGCWRVCWCVCVLVLVLVLVCRADPPSSPSLPHCPSLPPPHNSLPVYDQNAPRVYIQNVPVCTGTTPASVTTRGRGAGTHGDVLNVQTEAFWMDTWGFSAHHTAHTPRPQRQDTTTTTKTRGDRDTERQRQRETETKRDRERRQRKKAREDERGKTRQEKIERR